MAKINKYGKELDTEFNKLYGDLAKVKSESQKQRSIVRNDKLEAGQMEEGKAYIQNIGGTVYLKIKVDGVVKTATLS